MSKAWRSVWMGCFLLSCGGGEGGGGSPLEPSDPGGDDSGTLPASIATSQDRFTSWLLLDVDGDVDLFLGDEFVGIQDGAKIHPAVYLNDGSGRFTRKP